MPKFTIHEVVRDRVTVTAATAQEALDIWLANGTDHPAVNDERCAGVDERWVEDEEGNHCDVEDS